MVPTLHNFTSSYFVRVLLYFAPWFCGAVGFTRTPLDESSPYDHLPVARLLGWAVVGASRRPVPTVRTARRAAPSFSRGPLAGYGWRAPRSSSPSEAAQPRARAPVVRGSGVYPGQRSP